MIFKYCSLRNSLSCESCSRWIFTFVTGEKGDSNMSPVVQGAFIRGIYMRTLGIKSVELPGANESQSIAHVISVYHWRTMCSYFEHEPAEASRMLLAVLRTAVYLEFALCLQDSSRDLVCGRPLITVASSVSECLFSCLSASSLPSKKV